MFRGNGGGFEKDEGKDGEDTGLHETSKDFEGKEGQGQNIRYEVTDNDKEHFAGEDIAEETKGK